MIIGIVSDSHDNISALRKAIEILKQHEVTVLIHLGDISSPFTLRYVVEYPGKVVIVLGNNDGDKALLKEIALKAGAVLREGIFVFSISDRKLLLMHGFGSKDNTLEIVNALASSQNFNAVLYGHTHEVDLRYLGNTLVLNPGELCGYLSGKQTLAVLDLRTMKAEILEIS